MTKSSCEKSNRLWFVKCEVWWWNQTLLGGKSSSLEWSKAHHQKKNIVVSGYCFERQKNGKLNSWKYHLALWAAFNSGQYSVPKENKHSGRQILRYVPELGYMLLENLHHRFSLISRLLLHKKRKQLDPVDPQKNYKSWRDNKIVEISSALYGSYLLPLYQRIFKTSANGFWYFLKSVNNTYLLLVLTQLGMKYSQRCTSIN